MSQYRIPMQHARVAVTRVLSDYGREGIRNFIQNEINMPLTGPLVFDETRNVQAARPGATDDRHPDEHRDTAVSRRIICAGTHLTIRVICEHRDPVSKGNTGQEGVNTSDIPRPNANTGTIFAELVIWLKPPCQQHQDN
ncbi:hypothetical protein AAE478_001517 [Parahypoxylon ruwenzoriense]